MQRWFSPLQMAKTELAPPLAGAAVGLALFMLLQMTRDPPRWTLALSALGFLGGTLWSWTRAYGRLRALDDLPRSKIVSAAQGYARLEGRAASFPGQRTRSPGTQRECCWFSYQMIERDSDGNTLSSEKETSEWSFTMADGSGECVVDPAGAQVIATRVNEWSVGRFYYREETLLPGDRVFVVGAFSTSSDAMLERDIGLRVGELITQWKKDMPALIRRFDLSGDGRFDEQEWRLVRSQARREVEAALAETPAQPQNLVCRPRDAQPFIISAKDPQWLARDLTIWAWLHMVLLLGGAALLGRFAVF
jgi:hypothetical protein